MKMTDEDSFQRLRNLSSLAQIDFIVHRKA